MRGGHNTSDKPDKVLDCIGLYCPEPVFRTRLALDEMEVGQMLEVTADDPAAEEDIKRLVRRLGHEIVGFESDDDMVKFVIKKLK
ncbi:MAG: sulfurtransferase TusA family protein [Candidatus Bathyarchaeota archaeon]|nr:sulfurtransferase TusA family protein [Candidatus Bathyarchaeota archaeon]MDH5792246.1 sulfurtransferase TusA family protein [Candidatus Bathyarchaeota archaeon]